MKRHSEPTKSDVAWDTSCATNVAADGCAGNEVGDEWNALRDRIIGLGERSIHKSYYPELQQQLGELERFRALLDHSQDAILLAQLPSWRTVDANHAASRQFGYSYKDLLSLSVKEVVPQAVFEEIALRFPGLPSSAAQGCTITADIKRPDGTGNPVEMTVRSVVFDEMVYAVIVARDITERKAAEDAIEQQKTFLRRVIDTVPAFICVKDAQGRYELANSALAQAYGTTVERLEGHTIDEFIIPEELSGLKQRNSRVIETCETLQTPEERVTYADGSAHWVMATRTPLVEKDGTCSHVLAVGMDITQRKLAEDALEKRILALTRPLGDIGDIAFEDLFNLKEIQHLQDEFAKATGVGTVITQSDGTPITAPSNFSRLCIDVIGKTELGCASCRKAHAMVGRCSSDESLAERCGSSGLWHAGAGITVGGRQIAKWLIGQVRDDRQTEAEIVEYGRKIGADEKAIVEAFREVPRMSRVQFEQVGKMLFTLTNQLSNAAYQNIQQARFITERKRAEEALLRTKAELQQYVTALELSNHALQQVNHLAEAATRAKSEFLTNMSHEIRTPMTAILGYADVMLEEHISPTIREYLEVIKGNGKHLLDLINDILDLSKVESGKMQLEPIRCSPTDLLAEVVELMRVRSDAKDLRLTTELVGPIPETVLTDPLRFRQVLVNLVGNAIKFTDQGEVRLTAQLTENGGQTRFRVDVSDTGIGMSDDEVQRLFRAFSQVDNSATRRFGGSGMGLCISKHLVEALGGTIEVQSSPGKGSTFSLTIDPGPLDGIRVVQVASDAAARQRRILPSEGSKIRLHGRILLVEDGADNQRLISLLIRKAGAEIVAVENGSLAVEEALAARKLGNPFDVILMDMQMPVMDGYTAARQLRDRGYTGPIIALTAHAMDQDHEKCVAAGCDDYATKPIDRQQLLTTIARWSERKQSQCGDRGSLRNVDGSPRDPVSPSTSV